MPKSLSSKLKKYIFSILVFTAVIAADQLTKHLASIRLSGNSVALIDRILYFTLIKNTGVAFGFGSGSSLLLSLVGVIGFTSLFIFFPELLSYREAPIYLSLITGGAVSNLFDRLTKGFVIDFIDFRVWPVFNVADSCITIGMILLLISFIKNSERQEKE